jgi:hypothetical protein
VCGIKHFFQTITGPTKHFGALCATLKKKAPTWNGSPGLTPLKAGLISSKSLFETGQIHNRKQAPKCRTTSKKAAVPENFPANNFGLFKTSFYSNIQIYKALVIV